MTDRFAGEDLRCIRGGRLVFDGLDFALGTGEALILRGPNGSGKSSLLRLMAGLGAAAAGTLSWNGDAVAGDRAAHAERLHYVGHKNAFKPALTVRENLRFWAALRGGDTVEEALDAFGLARLADLPARLLSSGESRRLALARLAAAEAPLWLLDEPTVGLDQPSLERLVEQIRRHRVRGGMLAIAIHGPFVLDNARTLDMGTRGTQGTPS